MQPESYKHSSQPVNVVAKNERIVGPSNFNFKINITTRGFEVVLPEIRWSKHKTLILVAKTEDFCTHAEAQQAIASAQEQLVHFTEFNNLSKTFTPHFFAIAPVNTGGYEVKTLGLRALDGDYCIGYSVNTFTEWQRARDFYLQQRETMEKLTYKPILSLTLGDQTMSFSDFDSFNPVVAPSNTPKQIPSIAQALIKKSDRSEKYTYQNTEVVPDWESEVYKLVKDYVYKINPSILTQLEIKDLSLLTPKQASDLSIQIVIDLTKYNKSYIGATTNNPSRADESTVMQLLQDGLDHRDDPDWSGNGICSNFASCVKAVFEAIRSNQQKYNYLQNTYCLYTSGMEAYAPKRQSINELTLNGNGGHAWNTFLTVTDSETSAVIVDATWGKRDLETKQLKGVDYTLSRMEEDIFELAKKLDTKKDDEQFKKIFDFYLLKLEIPSLTGNHSSFAQQKQYYATRLLRIFFGKDIPESIPADLAEQVGIEFQKIEKIDKSEISCLFKLRQHSKFPFSSILQKYLDTVNLSVYDAERLIFENDGDKSVQDSLQKMVFNWVERREPKKFSQLVNDSPVIRARYREIRPDRLSIFDPVENSEDLKELKYFVSRNYGLSGYQITFGNFSNPTPENIQNILTHPIDELHKLNTEKSAQILAGKTAYEILKNYDKLKCEISKK